MPQMLQLTTSSSLKMQIDRTIFEHKIESIILPKTKMDRAMDVENDSAQMLTGLCLEMNQCLREFTGIMREHNQVWVVRDHDLGLKILKLYINANNEQISNFEENFFDL